MASRHDNARLRRQKAAPKKTKNLATQPRPTKLLPVPKEYRAFFLGELLTAAGLFFVGYELGSVGQQLNERLKQLNETIKGIANDIHQITQDIHTIVELIKQLPAQFRGIIEDQSMNEAYIAALTSQQTVRDWVQTENGIEAHQGKIEDHLEIIRKAVNTYLFYKGVSGLIHVSPLVAIHTQVNDVYQRWCKKNNKPYTNPFESAFHQDSVVTPLKEAFQKPDVFMRDTQKWFDRIPPMSSEHMFRFDPGQGPIGNPKFVETNYTARENFVTPVGTDASSLFLVTPIKDIFSQKFLPYKLFSSKPSGTVQGYQFWTMTEVVDPNQFPNPDLVREAKDFFDRGSFGNHGAGTEGIAYRDIWAPILERVRTDTEKNVFKTPDQWPGLG